MNSVEKFNALDGATISRKDLLLNMTQAFDEHQWEVHKRIGDLFDRFPEAKSFELSITPLATFKENALGKPEQKTQNAKLKETAKTGLKINGRLKKGYKYLKGGEIVKATKKKIKSKVLKSRTTNQPKNNAKKKKTTSKKIQGSKKKSKSKRTVVDKTQKKPIKHLGTVLIDVNLQPTPAVSKDEGLVSAEQLANISVEEPIVIPNTSFQKSPNGGNTNAIPSAKIDSEALQELKRLGFEMASDGPSTSIETFTLPGAIGGFLQTQQPHKALILIKGTKHTSKSQLAMQIANAFGEMQMPVAFIDYEQGGLQSKDTQNSVEWNTTPIGRQQIAIIGHLEDPFEELQKFCKYCKVIVADSVTDLSISADQLNELRSNYPDVIWIFISQVKENGEMYGGNKMAHNPTCIIKCHPSADPKKRYATLEKNRGNNLELAYSIFEKRLINVDEFTNTKISLPDSVTI